MSSCDAGCCCMLYVLCIYDWMQGCDTMFSLTNEDTINRGIFSGVFCGDSARLEDSKQVAVGASSWNV